MGRRKGAMGVERGVSMAAAGLVLVASCSSSSAAMSVSAPYFKGLDAAVVEEVVANPTARERVSSQPSATRASMAQGIARNFLVCRDALRVYRGWRTTGDVPALAPLPAVAAPAEPSNEQWVADFARLEGKVKSGDLDALRLYLTTTGSCGEWISEQPGGPTIKAVVEQLG